jgi:predicted DNA-binding transcriptional regulator AlpA
MTQKIPNLLDQKQVAEILGKSESWCERSRWRGDGPAYRKIGRHVRYELSDVLAFIKSKPKTTSSHKEGQ